MAAFLGANFILSTDAELILDSEDFNREVHLIVQDVAAYIGFTEAELDSNGGYRLVASSTPLVFTLPADEQLWAKRDTGATINVLVSAVQ